MTNNTNNTYDISKFGGNLRRLREELGINREDFAYSIGVCTRMIYDYEEGFKKPKLETAMKIAFVLGVTLDSMLR